MSALISDDDLREALDTCASEPVHTPGTIQPIGYLLAFEIETGFLSHASANCTELFDDPTDKLFGQHIRKLLGTDLWHTAQNTASLKGFAERRYFAGVWNHRDSMYSVHITKGDDFFVFEIENTSEMPHATPEMLREQAFLLNQIEPCQSPEELFDLTVRLLGHVTGFDRVLIYKFDTDWNGEVLAEKKKRSLESFLGLRFPHWDIPAQARAIMARVPTRIISDINQTPIPILADRADRPALDISMAQIRGVSPVHMQYLSNLDVKATMTLSIVLNGKLWGMISFHHTTPKIVQSSIRHILVHGVLPVFCLKLNLLQDRQALALSQKLDMLQSDMQQEMDRGTKVSELIARVGPAICDTLKVDGMAIVSGTQSHTYGDVPGPSLLAEFAKRARQNETQYFVRDTLVDDFSDATKAANGIAGVLALVQSDNRCLMVFRREVSQTINWAGNPAKTIETVSGNKRLQPRGSFSRYLEDVQGRCPAWTEADKRLTKQLWPLLGAAERQSFMADLSRQQALMIGELNHRVRNILALIKSVSHQARRSGGSLESYSQALEARIHALALAHDIGSGSAKVAVSVLQIIELEANPFADRKDRVSVNGQDFRIRSDLAPIFTLVIHELMTNAVKYGALSNDAGQISITLKSENGGQALYWKESGGPSVTEPPAKGFGATLISQALPFEMDGEASLEFLPSGIEARLWLPNSLLDFETTAPGSKTDAADPSSRAPDTATQANGLIMILEDNFLIATDLALILEQLGFPNSEIFARAEDAIDFLASETPALALLDVNLGQGRTSEKVATMLCQANIPVIFVTGYGDQWSMPPHLAHFPILTKPVPKSELASFLNKLPDFS